MDKALGNGFPIAAVAVKKDLQIRKQMLPGSTYATNALACAIVGACLIEMQNKNMSELVFGIEKTVKSHLSNIDEYGLALRGKGSLWVVAT